MSRSRPTKKPGNKTLAKKAKTQPDNAGVTVHGIFSNSPGGVAPVIQYEIHKPDGTSETIDRKTLKARNLELLADDCNEVNQHSTQQRLDALRAAKSAYANAKNTNMVKQLEALEADILKKNRGETKRIKR